MLENLRQHNTNKVQKGLSGEHSAGPGINMQKQSGQEFGFHESVQLNTPLVGLSADLRPGEIHGRYHGDYRPHNPDDSSEVHVPVGCPVVGNKYKGVCSFGWIPYAARFYFS